MRDVITNMKPKKIIVEQTPYKMILWLKNIPIKLKDNKIRLEEMWRVKIKI